MTKTILCCVSEWGYWGEELVGPYDVLTEHGYQIDFMTPTGQKPPALPASMQAGFWDPPLDKVVTSEHFANAPARSRIPTCSTSRSTCRPGSRRCRISTAPGSATAWRTTTPSATPAGRSWTNTTHCCWSAAAAQWSTWSTTSASTTSFSVFWPKEKLIAAECYCVTCLAFARDWTDRKSIIAGKHVTGHAREYDYKDGTGFAYPAVAAVDFGPPFYPLEYILRDAVGPDGQYHGGVGHTLSTILDYPFLTGRSTQDSQRVGELIIQVLEKGLRRYGW